MYNNVRVVSLTAKQLNNVENFCCILAAQTTFLILEQSYAIITFVEGNFNWMSQVPFYRDFERAISSPTTDSCDFVNKYTIPGKRCEIQMQIF